jgi:3-oxoadipate CoA-transferase alpha subunit
LVRISARNADGSAKETRRINGKDYVLEYPIYGDVALIKAKHRATVGAI